VIDLLALIELGTSIPPTIQDRAAWVMSGDTFQALKEEIRRVSPPRQLLPVPAPGKPVTTVPMLMGMPIRIRPVEGIAIEVEGIIGQGGRLV
jgi:hypothetical protein